MFKENFGIWVRPTQKRWVHVHHDYVSLKDLDDINLRIIATVLAQTAALDYYSSKARAGRTSRCFGAGALALGSLNSDLSALNFPQVDVMLQRFAGMSGGMEGRGEFDVSKVRERERCECGIPRSRVLARSLLPDSIRALANFNYIFFKAELFSLLGAINTTTTGAQQPRGHPGAWLLCEE